MIILFIRYIFPIYFKHYLPSSINYTVQAVQPEMLWVVQLCRSICCIVFLLYFACKKLDSVERETRDSCWEYVCHVNRCRRTKSLTQWSCFTCLASVWSPSSSWPDTFSVSLPPAASYTSQGSFLHRFFSSFYGVYSLSFFFSIIFSVFVIQYASY